MRNLLFDLPEGVQWNVMKFMRHPVAELFHEKWKDARTATDRGNADAYYGRTPYPNRWLFSVKNTRGINWEFKLTEETMTDEDIEEYYEAYGNQRDRKFHVEDSDSDYEEWVRERRFKDLREFASAYDRGEDVDWVDLDDPWVEAYISRHPRPT